MNKAIVAGLAAGVLIVGLVLSPVFTGFPLLSIAKAQDDTGMTKHFTLVADETEVQITPDGHSLWPGLKYNAMTFNGTVPGPVLAVHQGDTVEITMVNEGNVIHSMDFHSALTTTGANSGPIKPGESKTWSFKAEAAGAFFYHCSADGLNGVWEHIANGMYGGIVVHPHNETPAKEFYVAFNQIYTTNTANSTTAGSFDFGKFMAKNPDLVLTNGMAHKYVPAIGGVSPLVLNKPLADELAAGDLSDFFVVKPGELTRWYIVNAGPNDGIAFHFIGAVLTVRDGSIINRYGTQDKMDETWWIPPGSVSVIEAIFPQGGGPEGSPDGTPGIYVGVDHEMTDVVKGAAFAVVALDSEPAMADDQPEGTAVMSMEDTLKEQGSMGGGGSMTEDVKNSPDFKIADASIEGGVLTMTVEGTAGGTQPIGLPNDIYAYVFATDAGVFAATSHGAEDSEQVGNDIEWHTHKVTLDSNNCITGIESTADKAGTVTMDGNSVEIAGTGATSLDTAMTVKLTIGDQICVSEVFDTK